MPATSGGEGDLVLVIRSFLPFFFFLFFFDGDSSFSSSSSAEDDLKDKFCFTKKIKCNRN